MTPQFNLFVKDQNKSAEFYTFVLDRKPSLHVAGMTEFDFHGCILGLMPETGIKRLLGNQLPDLNEGRGIPRAELYLRVDDPQVFHERALRAGAEELSGLERRDWGDVAAYSLDPDGHILAFAKRLSDG